MLEESTNTVKSNLELKNSNKNLQFKLGLEQVQKKEQNNVSWDDLSYLTGFPADKIKKELNQQDTEQEEISLDQLRSLMLNFLDSTMMDLKSEK